MDHKKNYIQLYQGVVKAPSFLVEENASGFVQIGIILETLKNIIMELGGCEDCEECKKEESSKKPSDAEMECLRECVEMLGKVKEAMQK